MNLFARLLLLMSAVSCTGQDRIVQQDAERGIILRYTNTETVGCFGEPGIGGTAGSLRLEVEQPPGFYAVATPEPCLDTVSFDASADPITITCAGKTYPLYRLVNNQSILGPEGESRALHEVADILVKKSGRSVLKAIFTEAHSRGKMVEVLITLADTDCLDYWDVSFDGLSTADQKRVLDGLRDRPGNSAVRAARLDGR